MRLKKYTYFFLYLLYIYICSVNTTQVADSINNSLIQNLSSEKIKITSETKNDKIKTPYKIKIREKNELVIRNEIQKIKYQFFIYIEEYNNVTSYNLNQYSLSKSIDPFFYIKYSIKIKKVSIQPTIGVSNSSSFGLLLCGRIDLFFDLSKIVNPILGISIWLVKGKIRKGGQIGCNIQVTSMFSICLGIGFLFKGSDTKNIEITKKSIVEQTERYKQLKNTSEGKFFIDNQPSFEDYVVVSQFNQSIFNYDLFYTSISLVLRFFI
jgi:hypothetical protein